MPEISIIVPVYNTERYLRECIGSVLNQSFNDWELLLVDDGSTDASNSICRHYAGKDPRIILIEKSNGGLSSARNAGLDKACGRYITFLDSDDELYPDSMEDLYEEAERDGVDMVIGKGVQGTTRPDMPDCAANFTLHDPHDLCRDVLYRRPHPSSSAWGRIYRRDIFEDLRFYNGMYEDLEIFPQIALRCNRIAVTDKPLYFYRTNPASFINTWSESRRDAVKVTRMLAERLKDDPELEKAALNREFRANYNLLVMLLKFRPDDRDAIFACMERIRALRREVILDPRSRLSTRFGGIVSFFGLSAISVLARGHRNT